MNSKKAIFILVAFLVGLASGPFWKIRCKMSDFTGCILPEITISGTVSDYSSGEPLKGIEVQVYTYQQPPLRK